MDELVGLVDLVVGGDGVLGASEYIVAADEGVEELEGGWFVAELVPHSGTCISHYEPHRDLPR